MKKDSFSRNFRTMSALRQSVVAIVLIAGFPVMAIVYLGMMIWFQAEKIPLYIPAVVFSSTLVLVGAGMAILLKFPSSIMQLRKGISELPPDGELPRIKLLKAGDSEDLHYIEHELNMILHKMRSQIKLAEQNQRKEEWLRSKVEEQHRSLLQAERHRTMIQSLGAACHHLGQPVTSLRMRLYLMKQSEESTDEDRKWVSECEQDLNKIDEIIEKLRTVTRFQTEPYIGELDEGVTEILAI